MGLLWSKQWESEAPKKKILGSSERDRTGRDWCPVTCKKKTQREGVLRGRFCFVLLPWTMLLQ